MKQLLFALLVISAIGAKAQVDSSVSIGKYIMINGIPILREVKYLLIQDNRTVTIGPTGEAVAPLISLNEIRHALYTKPIAGLVYIFTDGTWAKGDTVQVTNILGDKNAAELYMEMRKP